MIKRIELVNFMSHERTVIEPSDGLTVLVGPNNCGKSAFVSALQILCHNAKSNYVMRHGEKKCEIVVETDDGHVVQWSRTKSGSPKYLIDGQEFDRLKGGVPDELHEILGLAKVNCEKDQFDVHFGEQKSPVFLLNDSGKASAQFFASSSDAIRLVEMQDRHKTKVRDAKRDQTRWISEKNRITGDLDLLDPVELISERLAVCERQFKEIGESDAELEQTAIMIKALRDVQGKLTEYEATTECLGELTAPPALEDTESLGDLVGDVERTDTVFRQTTDTLSVLEEVSPPPRLSDTNAILGLLEDWTSVESLCGQLGSRNEALSRLALPPETQDESGLLQVMEKISFAVGRLSHESKLASALGELTPVPDQLDQSPLESMLQELAAREKRWKLADRDSKQLDQQVEALTGEMKNWVEENPDCPMCGAETTVDHLMQRGGHSHG